MVQQAQLLKTQLVKMKKQIDQVEYLLTKLDATIVTNNLSIVIVNDYGFQVFKKQIRSVNTNNLSITIVNDYGFQVFKKIDPLCKALVCNAIPIIG